MKNMSLLVFVIFFVSSSQAMDQCGGQTVITIVSPADFKARLAERQAMMTKLKRREEKWLAKEQKYEVVNGRIQQDLKAMDLGRDIEFDSPVYRHVLFQRYIIAQENEAVLCLLDFDKENLLGLGDPLAKNLYDVYKCKINMFHFDPPQNSQVKFEMVAKLALWLAEQGKNNDFLANYYSHK